MACNCERYPEVTEDEARRLLDGTGYLADYERTRALSTVISQSQKKKRLQAAIRDLMVDLTYSEKIVHDKHSPIREWKPPKLEDYDLTEEDMQ